MTNMLNDKETSYMSFSCLNDLHLHADGLRHLVHEMHRKYMYVGKNLTFNLKSKFIYIYLNYYLKIQCPLVNDTCLHTRLTVIHEK